MQNIDLFNGYVAQTFSRLYENFPVEAFVDARFLCGHDEVDDFGCVVDRSGRRSRPFEIALATLVWLSDSGYVTLHGSNGYGHTARLTEKGLVLLRSVPKSLSASEPFGDRLQRLVSEGSMELASSAIKALISTGFEAFIK